MSLSIVSNLAASVANRALQASDAAMTTSLRKLSSGLRVESAKDDAASMAIGSRLKAEQAALKTVSTNAQQGIAVFQIAEGGYARIYDILVRLKSLASQAGSSQLSNTERGMLDTEYQSMLDEIDRLAANTTFNGNSLINANYLYTKDGVLAATNAIDFAFGGGNTNAFSFSIGSDANGNITALASQTGGATMTGSLASNQVSGGKLISGTALRLSGNSATQSSTVAGVPNSYMTVSLAKDMDITTAVTTARITTSSSSTTNFAFKVGTSGVSANDQISLDVRGMNTKSLGVGLSGITSIALADSAAAATTEAINILLNARSEVGAVQNRLESAQSNINTILENIEAARSSQLDLDVASEMTAFTSKQILVQAGVAMLAQANQAPKDLLRLFQN